MPCKKTQRQKGVSLIELLLALTTFTVVSAGTGMMLVNSDQQRRVAAAEYRATSALRDLIAEVQEKSNLPQNLVAGEGIASIYMQYNDYKANIPNLPGAVLSIECFADEDAIPAALGGSQDLNFDGDTGDDLTYLTNGTDLLLVPMRITLTFGTGSGKVTRVLHRLITRTTD